MISPRSTPCRYLLVHAPLAQGVCGGWGGWVFNRSGRARTPAQNPPSALCPHCRTATVLAGRPISNTTVKILDEDTQELPAEEVWVSASCTGRPTSVLRSPTQSFSNSRRRRFRWGGGSPGVSMSLNHVSAIKALSFLRGLGGGGGGPKRKTPSICGAALSFSRCDMLATGWRSGGFRRD